MEYEYQKPSCQEYLSDSSELTKLAQERWVELALVWRYLNKLSKSIMELLSWKARKERVQLYLLHYHSLQAEEKVTLIKSKMKNQTRLFYLGAVIIALIVIVIYAYNVIAVEMYQGQIEAENQLLSEQKIKLENELKNVRDPKYIEQQARTQLRMIFPGEILYILPEKTKENNESN